MAATDNDPCSGERVDSFTVWSQHLATPLLRNRELRDELLDGSEPADYRVANYARHTTNVDHLNQLVNHPARWVQTAAFNNPHLPQHTIDTTAVTAQHGSVTAQRCRRLTPSLYQQLLDRYFNGLNTFSDLLANPQIGVGDLGHAVRQIAVGATSDPNGDNAGHDISIILVNPTTTAAHIRRLQPHMTSWHRTLTVNHQNANEAIIRSLVASDPGLHLMATSAPACPTDWVQAATTSPDSELRSMAAVNPNLPTAARHMLLDDPDVADQAAANPATTLTDLCDRPFRLVENRLISGQPLNNPDNLCRLRHTRLDTLLRLRDTWHGTLRELVDTANTL